MKYEYTKSLFKKASEAVIAVENGAELFVIEDASTFRRARILNACANFDLLYTRKEKAIDFEKEFTLDTPWMVKNENERRYVFRYACAYLKTANNCMGKFVVFSSTNGVIFHKLDTAIDTSHYIYARHLTKEEEIKYLL